jgi:hypothetical protein
MRKSLLTGLALGVLSALFSCSSRKEPGPEPAPDASPVDAGPPRRGPVALSAGPALPKTPPPLAPLAPADYQETEALASAGAIRGRVVWKGPPPLLEPFPVEKDQAVCGRERPSHRLLIGTNGGVRFAVVFLADIRRGKKRAVTPEATLEHTACELSPRVQVVPVGTSLTLVNSDPILHNTHAFLGAATVFNVGMPVPRQRIKKPLQRVGLLEVHCDAGHPWTGAYLHVVPHPYYAVTDERGAFSLTEVPPGTYRLRVWHEGWRVLRRSPDGRLDFEPPRELEQLVTVPERATAWVEIALAE